MTAKLEEWIGLYDTCGIHNLHGIPGILGGIFSAIIIAAYTSVPLASDAAMQLGFSTPPDGRTFFLQGGFQIAGTFSSLGIALVGGIVAGIIIRLINIYEPKEFYNDSLYFEVPDSNEAIKSAEMIEMQDSKLKESPKKESSMARIE